MEAVESLPGAVLLFLPSYLNFISRPPRGLDPAGPNFEYNDPACRLDPTDATFVDVIHSDGETLLELGMGLQQPVKQRLPWCLVAIPSSPPIAFTSDDPLLPLCFRDAFYSSL